MQIDYAITFATSQSIKEAKSRFKALAVLDDNRREVVRLIMALCEFARLAYGASYGWTGKANGEAKAAEKSRMILSGDYAGQYCAVFRHIRQTIGTNDTDIISKVQSTSDWLRARGLNGIPNFVASGATTTITINKTAEQMHRDMLAYVEYARDSRQDAQANEEAKRAA